ncbi:hypothetical protein GUITHDRAFT_112392 [Guillardia theta CCMP2712]|uniref:Uncharacterized protein n=1 Tax=Guillardia theta (strain CCMP2712) TaxID=905079 RepID=L1J0L6_GUITC|nr:hypothetical protein GUITHDRAFT_112392 [Guillardia theta CCMP2712]EKX41684.1 hypothetical protein GUITHDRAFT_112392 [Guillardia theta CCMP2712]|eukprot:XP_005828664.1 hypothetical protein GUITHDRAFT_112392 [Guillardia theta CCMP2712]
MAPPYLSQTRIWQRRFLRGDRNDDDSSNEDAMKGSESLERSHAVPWMDALGGLTRENWLKWLHAVGVHDKILSLQVFKMLLSLAQSANLEKGRWEARDIEELWKHLKSIDSIASPSSEYLTTKTFLEFMYSNNLFVSVPDPVHGHEGSLMASNREAEASNFLFLDTDSASKSRTIDRVDAECIDTVSNLSDFKRDIVSTISTLDKPTRKFKTSKRATLDRVSQRKPNGVSLRSDLANKRISELEEKVRDAEDKAMAAERREKQALELVKEHIQLYTQAETDLELLSEMVKKNKVQGDRGLEHAMNIELANTKRLLEEERQRNDLLQVKLRQKELECKDLLKKIYELQTEKVCELPMSKADLRSSSLANVSHLKNSLQPSMKPLPREQHSVWSQRWRFYDSDSDTSDSSEEPSRVTQVSKPSERKEKEDRRPFKAGEIQNTTSRF